jgi:hypothetical protein
MASVHVSIVLSVVWVLWAQIFNGPRCRFPIQLELLQPAELADKMCARAPAILPDALCTTELQTFSLQRNQQSCPRGEAALLGMITA